MTITWHGAVWAFAFIDTVMCGICLYFHDWWGAAMFFSMVASFVVQINAQREYEQGKDKRL